MWQRNFLRIGWEAERDALSGWWPQVLRGLRLFNLHAKCKKKKKKKKKKNIY
eukprot:NODE_9935_length_323_cov_218.059701.p2 GENE.NODE_9935_length_323_cov_218.059701~~NODE_9935_length_323_cov_218.059701.p2  ORF type:complete len:52 (+),score=32.08 NODE_9935_length_323_cov_218.059701:131-286(+)